MNELNKVQLLGFLNEKGQFYYKIPLYYEVFGLPLGTAPIILVNHALTGNSTVTGENGWWTTLIGENKAIDTNFFTVISFNIPGNGYDGHIENLIENYADFTARDIAELFLKGLELLKIDSLFATIGGSLGGGIAWEMAILKPNYIKHLIPIATNYIASNWVIAKCLIQESILLHSKDPIHDARLHAMMIYRTPESINQRFNRKIAGKDSLFEVENWLLHHGDLLKKRFKLSAYKLMNNLLKTIDITRGRVNFVELLQNVQSNVHIVAINSDLLFTSNEIKETFKNLETLKSNVFYHEIKSIHGHDAFLIEIKQVSEIISPIFKQQRSTHYVNQ